MIEHASKNKMEDDKDLYEALYRMVNRVDIKYAYYEEKIERE